MYYKIAQLMLTPGKKAGSISEVFVAQPDANKEALAGKLFALIEIESKRSGYLKIINFLLDQLNHNYYQGEKMILRERVSSIKVDHIFESALAKTNKSLAEFLQAEKIKLDPNIVNITIGVIYENNLYFSNLGKNKALLIIKSKAKTSNGKYKIVDITKQTNDNEAKKRENLGKIFTNVISGSIPSNCFFIFTNETLPEYLSNNQLSEIITTLPPASAVEQIKNVLTKINAYVSFLGIIIKNTKGEKPSAIKRDITPVTSHSSIEGLNVTEDTTEKLLTPSGIINFKKWLAFINETLAKIKIRLFKPALADKKILLKDKIFSKRKPSWLSINKIFIFIKDIILFLANFTAYLFRIITNKERLLNSYRSAKSSLINKIKYSKARFLSALHNIAAWFKNLSKKNKVLLVVAVVCLLLLSQNLLLVSLKNKKQEIQQDYNALIKKIEQKQNQVEASLLYSNETKAKELLGEVKELLAQLPKETAGQDKQYNKLKAKQEQQLEKVRHVIKIESPAKLADFANLNSGAKPANLMLFNNIIYSGDSEQKTIYSLDITNNLITAITDLKLPIKELNYPVIDNNNNVYYFNAGGIIRLDAETEEIKNFNINLPGNLQNIVSVDSYNNRLYLLDKQNGQVYRYRITNNGFINLQSWIKEKADFSDAASLSIDGHIYILKSNGELSKYLKGQSQEFILEMVEPIIEQAKKVIVSDELKYIYILEPVKQRLIIFDKTGEFLLQYQSDEFNGLKDFIVNEETKKIYFLNNTSVYEIEGAHFEE